MNKNLDEIVEYRGVTDLVVAEVLSDNNKEGEGYKTGEVYELAGVGEISKSTSNSSESKYYNNMAAIVINSVGADEIKCSTSVLPLDKLAFITGQDYDETTGTKPYNWSESNGVMTVSSKTSYREPDVVPKNGSTGYDMDSRLKTLGLGAKTTHEFLNQLEKEFNNMVASVEKYGGFYIGRYETGNINQDTPVVQKGNTNISSQTWYNMYKRCKNIKGDNTNVETGMIWGNQWDRTLMWLIETGSKTKEQIADDSTSWGNYYNSTFEYVNSSGSTATKNENSSTRIPTGSTEYTKANNIYDLAGNVRDWTMEAGSTSYRVYRGGYCYDNGTYGPAGGRYYGGPAYSSYDVIRLSCSTLHKVILVAKFF